MAAVVAARPGVKIGVYYQKPRYVEEDMDMLRLQSFLIHDPDRLKRDYWVNRILIGLSLVGKKRL